ncbi:hypothetical protein FNB79_15470 [Formosa sediminum]|uniref:Uncharacterized protein n=1 Tax=Formosa sediminum TaxID=2594004 RepID=A0A516GV91_9FLAO|nr:hypothetical protein [Formosa sediminum]QDO95310.1 hypothetical protein FNB79_15470 [Formosa sediminum]
MDLYIEKAFLDDFYLTVDLKQLNQAQNCVMNFFKEYGNINAFLDIKVNSLQELENLKSENYVFNYLINDKAYKYVSSVKDAFFIQDSTNQTVIFTQNSEPWFSDAEAKGALCFSIENYESKISKLIQSIESINFDFDELPSWKCLEELKAFPNNSMIICDNYLYEKGGRKIKNNLIPILESVMLPNSLYPFTLKIFTKEVLKKIYDKQKTIKQLKKHNSFIQSKLTYLGRKIVIQTSSTAFKDYDLHARELVSNFYMVTSGRGFNVFPRENTGVSNEIIIANSIFNKLGYNRIYKRLKLYNEYQLKLKKIESINFIYHPEK